MNFSQLYKESIGKLRRAGIETADVDAALLLEFCSGLTRSRLYLSGANEVPAGELEQFSAVLERRLSREPLQYITGTREFWSLDFIVSPAVLVPRPETEFVLDTVLASVKKHGYRGGPVLDMCTGSGVIAVVLAKEFEPEGVIAVDRSSEALFIASLNLHKFGVEQRVRLVCSDLFTALGQGVAFEIIVANPPYIADADMEGLEPEVRDWEPRSALAAGEKGLDVIHRIAEQAHTYLQPGGWLFMEIGSDQGNAVGELFTEKNREYADAVVLPDWSGHPRLLIARKSGNVQ